VPPRLVYRIVFFILFFCLFSFAGGSSLAAGTDPKPFFFYYNPDASQSNLVRLKQEMDHLLASQKIKVSFQPFNRLLDFHQQVQSVKPIFFFLPHWYLQKYGQQLKLQPLLTPVRAGQSSYRKILLVAKNADTAIGPALKNQSLAMTTMGPDEEAILDAVLFASHGIKAAEINIVDVPKDVDALFALALGQVNMALVTRNTLETLTIINPRLVEGVKPVMETIPLPMPVLCAVKEGVSADFIKIFVDIFKHADAATQKEQYMEILQIDGWKEVTPN